MANIILPGYETIVPNGVFGKEAKSFQGLFSYVKTTQITIIKRFTFPSQDDVIEFIERDCAKKIKTPLKKNASPDEEILYNTQERIANKDKSILNHLRDHYGKPRLEIGKNYIDVSNGILPNYILDIIKEKNEMLKGRIYERGLVANGEILKLTVKLLEDGGLPNKEYLEPLINDGVNESRTLLVSGNFSDYNKDVAAQVRLIYENLNPELIKKVDDESCQVLESLANSTFESTYSCILGATKHMDEILKHVIPKMFSLGL